MLNLLDGFDKAVERFARLTSDLKAATNASLDEFQAVIQQCERALDEVHEAKITLQKHGKEHGC